MKKPRRVSQQRECRHGIVKLPGPFRVTGDQEQVAGKWGAGVGHPGSCMLRAMRSQ